MVFDAYKATGDSVMAGVIEKARVGADIQVTRFPGQDRRIAHGVEAGQVISRVEALPREQRALVLYLFGPYTHHELDPLRSVVEAALVVEVLGSDLRIPGQEKGREAASRARRQLEVLCAAALYHHGQVTWPYRRKGLPTPQAVRQWAEDEAGTPLEGRWSYGNRPAWRHLWELCASRLDEWEKEGLAPVGELLHQQKTPAGAGA